ncbi:MAG: hypothetical protein V4458_01005 [Pseudomonadota bacterium]|nr:hypothetical protein [Afipia sp.]
MKRSSQVALLLMGTTAIGGTAYTMMPGENCSADRPAISSPGSPQANDCARRSGSSSSSGGGGHRSSGGSSSSSSQGLFGNNSSSSNPTVAHDSNHVTRGGFGSFAHSFTSHFSGGG